MKAVHEGIGGIEADNESTVPVESPVNVNPNSNKRQSDSGDLDDQDQPRIIKTIPGNQRRSPGILPIINSGPGTIDCFVHSSIDDRHSSSRFTFYD